LSKASPKPPVMIQDPQRCDICDTTLTLYPPGAKECPHCHRKVCRLCWGEAWMEKKFSAENCAHRNENENPGGMAPVAERVKRPEWDWQKTLFVGLLAVLAIISLIFLWNLFIF
jgi:hypothetical protein